MNDTLRDELESLRHDPVAFFKLLSGADVVQPWQEDVVRALCGTPVHFTAEDVDAWLNLMLQFSTQLVIGARYLVPLKWRDAIADAKTASGERPFQAARGPTPDVLWGYPVEWTIGWLADRIEFVPRPVGGWWSFGL